MFVIMSGDGKCVVRGKTRKYLCGIDEPTKKELVSYNTHQNAKSAVMRMYLLKSPAAEQLYGDAMPPLVISEQPMIH
ncbi:MAG: hypothetical protein FWH02_00220 [Oscillospiraceae bacterium]|nr:hypothetical protein [Oscillospiraceae bacterium]